MQKNANDALVNIKNALLETGEKNHWERRKKGKESLDDKINIKTERRKKNKLYKNAKTNITNSREKYKQKRKGMKDNHWELDILNFKHNRRAYTGN